jgi:hypothetical protein
MIGGSSKDLCELGLLGGEKSVNTKQADHLMLRPL